MIEITLSDYPEAWAASKTNGKRHYNPKHAQKERTRWQIKSQYTSDPIVGIYAILFDFHIEVPSYVSKSVKEKMLKGGIIPTKFDTTNCQKFYEDCLKGIVITDDRYVRRILSDKCYADKTEVKIRVYTWEEYANCA